MLYRQLNLIHLLILVFHPLKAARGKSVAISTIPELRVVKLPVYSTSPGAHIAVNDVNGGVTPPDEVELRFSSTTYRLVGSILLSQGLPCVPLNPLSLRVSLGL